MARKIKNKKKKRSKKINSKKNYKKEGRNVFLGLVGFILTLLFVQLSYKGPDEVLTLNPIQVVNFFSAQINVAIGISGNFAIILGIIILVIPPVAFYFLSKEIFN